MTSLKTPVILLTSSVFQSNLGDHHELLRQSGMKVIARRGPLPESELLELVGEVDAILCDPDDITFEVIKKAVPRLKMITKVGAGTASIDIDACRDMGVQVFNTAGLTREAVAEHTIALALAVAREIVPSSIETKNGMWRKRHGSELRGKNFGIIGCGRIGFTVARIANALGMNVHAFRRSWQDTDTGGEIPIKRCSDIAELVKNCEILSLHAMLNTETRHLIDRSMFALMKEDTILINTSRAALVEPNALLEALNSGKLAGYGADVMESEPPDPFDPILIHPKTVITPHIGSLTKESIPRQLESATRRLLDFFHHSVLVKS